MLEIYRKLYDLLDHRERYLAGLVFGLMVLVALTELVGVASIMPFIAVLSNPGMVHSNAYLAAAYDALGMTSTDAFLFYLGVAVFLLLVGSLAMKAFGFWVQVRFSTMRTHSFSYRLVARYLGQPYEWFLNRHSSDIATSVLAEVNQVVNGALFPAMQIVAHGLVVCALVTLLVLVDPLLATLSALVLGTFYGGIFMAIRKRLRRVGVERRAANRARFHIVQEAFGGIKELKVNALESTLLERYRSPSTRMAKRTSSAKLLSELPSFALQALLFGGMMLVVLYLMNSHGSLQAALPTLGVFALASYRLLPAMQQLYAQVSQLRVARPVVEELYEDLRTANGPDLPRHDVPPLGLDAALELRSVRYAYPEADRPALLDVDLTVQARTTVALVGATGSGKTTIVDLILGLLRPQAGGIHVDGQPVTPANLRAWQRTLGYVPQQIYLTDDSIAANIAFGIPHQQIDMAAVERAAKVAELHDFVIGELPEGYHSGVGERGVRLSGGQRQRIGIARALYHDPDVLILDEATSALDNITERSVMAAVHNLGHRKTIILVAHRLSTVESCDRIHVLERGRLIASGTYGELVETCDAFQRMASPVAVAQG